MTMSRLLEKIRKKKARICVIGLGQVGLPTALTFCKSGFDVIGNDTNKNLLHSLSSKKIKFEETGLNESLTVCINSGRFHTNENVTYILKDSDVVIVCVPTPLTESGTPDLSALETVCRSISEYSIQGKLIIIESSVPPGTFTDFILPFLTKKNKLGKDFWAAFVPERLAPSNALKEIQSFPRVIGCEDKNSGLLAKELYVTIVNSKIFITTTKTAELSKLVENTYRDVSIAFANEVGLICEKYGVDVAELIEACNSHPRVNMLQPGPGVGGPCLPKDPHLLLNPQRNGKINSRIILESRKINDNMPYHVVNLVVDALKAQNKEITDSKVLILGVAYKANVSDTRLSPAREIISQLIKMGCQVLVSDPKTKENFGGQNAKDIPHALSCSDVLLIVTDHDEFKKLDLEIIQRTMKKIPIIVDTRRIFSRKKAEQLGIHYLSVGYNKPLKSGI